MKKVIAAAALLASSSFANAEPVLGVGYSSFDADIATLGALMLTAGYEFGESTGWAVVPEVSLGTGIQDDSYRGVTVEIDRYAEFALRAEYVFESNAYLFAKPSYGNLKVEASAFGNSASASDSEFGYGGGAGIQFSGSSAVEFFFQKFDDTDVLGVSYRHRF